MLKYFGLIFAACGIILTMYGVRADQELYDFDLYSYAAPQSNAVTVVFGNITNNSDDNDKIISIAIDNSSRTELHTMAMDNNIMKMRKVDAFAVTSGDTKTLSHMGDHIMVFDRSNDWIEGDAIKAVVKFAKAGEIPVSIQIKSRGEKNGHGHNHHHH
jgi:copper(I)-binding protein